MIVGIMVAFFVGSVALLKVYQLDMIETIVVNALVQKSPRGQSSRIRATFARNRTRLVAGDREGEYLNRLFEISQRLERTQEIDLATLNEILTSLGEEPN